jgi:hypothetical protein
VKRLVVILALVLPAACFADVNDDAVPATSDIERLEQRLSQHDCVADLSQWERNYRYSRKTGLFTPYSLNPDFDVIEFHFRRVGTVRIDPGRKIMVPGPGGDWPDSNPIHSLDGKFTLSTGSLAMGPCDPAKAA